MRMYKGTVAGVCALLLGLGCAEPEAVPIEPPQPMSDSMPFVYPVELWDRKISGQTILLIRVSELGVVDSVMVATTSGYEEFDSSAVSGARTMKFTPGRQGEHRVPMWTKMPVRFARDTTKAMGLGGDNE
jgi:TonB family protein